MKEIVNSELLSEHQFQPQPKLYEIMEEPEQEQSLPTYPDDRENVLDGSVVANSSTNYR